MTTRPAAIKEVRSGWNLDVFWRQLIPAWSDLHVRGKQESRVTWFFGWATGRTELPSIVMGKAMRRSNLTEHMKLSFEHLDFGIGYMSLQFREEVWARDLNVGHEWYWWYLKPPICTRSSREMDKKDYRTGVLAGVLQYLEVKEKGRNQKKTPRGWEQQDRKKPRGWDV